MKTFKEFLLTESAHNIHVQHALSAAKRQEVEAKKWGKGGDYSDPVEGGDSEMVRDHKNNAKNWRKIADHLKKGEIKKAAKRHDEMDTDVRDNVHSRTYNFLQNTHYAKYKK
jgi:hypothetical protein